MYGKDKNERYESLLFKPVSKVYMEFSEFDMRDIVFGEGTFNDPVEGNLY